QIVSNFIGNAIKFTEKGTITLGAEILEDLGDAIRVKVSCSDTGIGIDPQHRDTVFEPFVQVDGSTTRKHGGVGLGLAICRKLIGLMGGTIGMNSNEGQGSTFWFELALKKEITEDRACA
ncbi:ATP-binding protein, partial [Candidatus Eisenbacteria bacterium]